MNAATNVIAAPALDSEDDVRCGHPRAASDWRACLPVLSCGELALREVKATDADALAALMATPEVSRYLSPPPASADEFERFILGSQRMRAQGEGVCFVLTQNGSDTPIGLFQLRLTTPAAAQAPPIDGTGDLAEWGFAVGLPFWGTGVFRMAAALVLEFAFERLGVQRVEARCAVKNGRGGRALMKVGAVPEGILRKAFTCGNEQVDQVLYAVVEQDWRASRDRTRAETLSLVH